MSRKQGVYTYEEMAKLIGEIKDSPQELSCVFQIEPHPWGYEIFKFREITLEVADYHGEYFYIYSVKYPDQEAFTQPCRDAEPNKRFIFTEIEGLGQIFSVARIKAMEQAEISGDAAKKKQRDEKVLELLEQISKNSDEVTYLGATGAFVYQYEFRGYTIQTQEMDFKDRFTLVGYFEEGSKDIARFTVGKEHQNRFDILDKRVSKD